jgi:sugar phosphate isomerase/epimerase
MTDATPTVNRNLLATCWTWAGNVGPGWEDERSPLQMGERLRAVADAGWQGIGLVDADLAEARATYGLPVLRRMIEDAGIGLVELEFLTEWWTSGERRAHADRQRQLVFDAAAELGATTIKAGGDHSPEPVAWDEFATAFDALATDAGSHGLRIALEPMPMNNIRTLERGVELVRAVSNPHGGLCIDAWHVQRGGNDYDDLPALVDIERVFVVELDDARQAILGSTMTSDANDWRLYPGEGELDIPRFVAQMVRAGWSGHWGVEIISSAHRALPVAEGATRVHEATARALEAAQERLHGR